MKRPKFKPRTRRSFPTSESAARTLADHSDTLQELDEAYFEAVLDALEDEGRWPFDWINEWPDEDRRA